MTHSVCPICTGKLSELLPGKDDKKVGHKVYICDNEIDHKFWVSEYESDSLRWNPAVNFEENIYFRKFKSSKRDLVRELALKELKDIVDAEGTRFATAESTSLVPTELATDAIEKTYNETPDYVEIHDKHVHENLLGIIQSLNNTIKALIEEYHKLETYTDDLQAKYDKVLINPNVTPSGIILKV